MAWARAALSVPANRLIAQQGMGGHTVKPMSRGVPSGRPFNAHFVDVAANAGLRMPVIYGDEETEKYIDESTGCGCAFIDYDNDGWTCLCFRAFLFEEHPKASAEDASIC